MDGVLGPGMTGAFGALDDAIGIRTVRDAIDHPLASGFSKEVVGVLLGMPTEEKMMATTALGVLLREGVPDLGALRRMSVSDLMSMRNIGEGRALFLSESFGRVDTKASSG